MAGRWVRPSRLGPQTVAFWRNCDTPARWRPGIRFLENARPLGVSSCGARASGRFLSACAARERECLVFRKLSFEAQREVAAHPDQHVAVNANRPLLDPQPAIEVTQCVGPAFDPERLTAVYLGRLDAGLAEHQLLQ